MDGVRDHVVALAVNVTMSSVERVELAPGLSISRVVTGMWQIAELERHLPDGATLDPVATAAAMKPYVDAGLTSFDMADHYGSAEVIAGQFLRSNAGNAEVFTKICPKAGPVTRDDVRAAVARARGRLGLDGGGGPIPLLQLHTWAYWHPSSYLGALRHLAELQREGAVGHVGLTNFDTAHLRIVLASGLKVVSNQVCYSLLDDRPARGGMAALCAEHGVQLLCYGTLGGGLLTDRFLDELRAQDPAPVAAAPAAAAASPPGAPPTGRKMPSCKVQAPTAFPSIDDSDDSDGDGDDGGGGGGGGGGGSSGSGGSSAPVSAADLRAELSGASRVKRDEPTTWSMAKYQRFVDAAGGAKALRPVLEAARAVADKHGVSLANVAVRWVLQRPSVAAAIVGARLGRTSHIADTLNVFKARRDSAEDFCRLKARRCTATDRIFIPAYCFALP